MLFNQTAFWVRSSPGRAPDLHSGGSEFDSRRIHQNEKDRVYHVNINKVGGHKICCNIVMTHNF